VQHNHVYIVATTVVATTVVATTVVALTWDIFLSYFFIQSLRRKMMVLFTSDVMCTLKRRLALSIPNKSFF
jgi:hypothetical protein